MKIKNEQFIQTVATAFTLLACSLYCIRTAHAVTFDWAIIGSNNNSADPETGHGAVLYKYSISKTEVTNAQYTEFLNSVAASDANALFDTLMETDTWGGITRNGSSGSYAYSIKADAVGQGPGGNDYTYANKPVVYVSFLDAIRFVNWLENGQPTGPQGPSTTEDGAYSIENGWIGVRKPNASFFIPNEDEWYKAAYFDPEGNGGSGIYYDYPTSSDSVPNNNPPLADTGNSANFFDGSYATGRLSYPMTDVGAYRSSKSPYGTFDQGGNVFEWTETLVSTNIGALRSLRGGDWSGEPGNLHARHLVVDCCSQNGEGGRHSGIRVASSIPEPTSWALMLPAVCCAMVRRQIA